MPAYARKTLIPNGADCLVHTISRCVRRAWLCGEDAYSGRNFDHRRQWVRDRAKMLVNHFAIEVLAYAVMSNHSHFVLWVRPSVAAEWSAQEVARRWLWVFGKRANGPTRQEVAQAVGNAERIALWRGRLGDVSWFMRCLNEWVARKANAEDECTGRFWEGRFTSQRLEDEGAVLACMAYVDLNPVRSKMVRSLEESHLTSVHDRICAKRAGLRLEAMRQKAEGKAKSAPTAEQAALVEEATAECGRAGWLCRFGNEIGEGGGHTVLSMRFEDYVELLEWTGRCVVEGKKGSIPSAALPVLERMELEVENWVETVEQYGSIYHRVAGKLENLKRRAQELGQRWVSGQGKGRWVFRKKLREKVERKPVMDPV